MKVIEHETEGEHFDRKLALAETNKNHGIVAVFVKDRPAAVPTVQHMTGVAGHLSRGIVHESGKALELQQPQGKVARPFNRPNHPRSLSHAHRATEAGTVGREVKQFPPN